MIRSKSSRKCAHQMKQRRRASSKQPSLVHEIPVRSTSEPIPPEAALPLARIGTNSGIRIPASLTKQADARGAENARPSIQSAIGASNANVVVADKQRSDEKLKVAAIGIAKTQNNQTGLRVAEVRFNNVPAAAQQRSHTKFAGSDRQNERRNARFWSNVFLISVLTGLLLWFVIGRAASGSLPQPPSFRHQSLHIGSCGA